MALVIEDRVRETTTTSGTGTIALAGAFAGFQPFSVIGNGNTTYYCIIDAANGEWEVGVGTYTASGNTLSRDTVLSSSNLGGLVNFASTTKDVICTQPAERAVYLDSATNATIPGITLSGGTANGVAYLDGSKAITTGSALTFDGSQLDIPLGSAAAPSLSTPTDPNTGIFFPAADTIAFTEGGVESMRINSSGNLGLGVTPSALWQSGIKAFQIGSSGAIHTFGTASSQIIVAANNYYDGTNNVYLNNGFATQYSQTTGVHAWFTSPSGTAGNAVSFTQAMTLNASGNLGVGSIAPVGYSGYSGITIQNVNGGFINLRNNANTNQMEIAVEGGGNTSYVKTVTSMPLTFGTNNIERMRLDASGNLGIGTTSPANPLNIVRDNVAFRGQLSLQTASASNFAQITFYDQTTFSGQIYQGYGFDKAIHIANPLAHGVAFWTNNTERMRLDASGNLGLGTTSPSFRLDAVNNVAGLARYSFSNPNAGMTQTDIRVGAGTNTNDVYLGIVNGNAFIDTRGTNGVLAFQRSGTESMRLDASGRLGIGTTNPLTPLVVSNGNNENIEAFVGSVSLNGGGFQYINRGAGASTTRPDFNYYLSGVGSHKFYTNDLERVRINSSGNLGIGTTTVLANARLDVRDVNRTGNATNQVILTTTAQAADIGGTLGLGGLWNATDSTMFGTVRGGKENSTSGNYAGYLSFGTVANGGSIAERARIDSIGNLGVGTTPLNLGGLMVNVFGAGNGIWSSNSRQLISSSNAYFGSLGWTYAASTFAAAQYSMNNGLHTWLIAPTGTAGNAITFTQAMTLDASGNLGIGTTSPATRLDVAANGETIRLRGDGTSTTNPSIRTDTSTNPNGNVRNALGAVSSSSLQVGYVGTLSNHPLTFFVNDAERARIDASGNLIQSAPATPPTLATNGTMVFNLTSNTNLRVSVRGSDGVTRTANITLA